MINRNQDGAVSGLLVLLILVIMLLLGALGFGAWSYSQQQKYKNDVDSIVADATEAARQAEAAAKTKEFIEKEKQPLKIYHGPDTAGSLSISYPKTWSGYVDTSGVGQASVDGYFSPDVVPSITNLASIFALRVQVVHQPYAQVLQNFAQQQRSGVPLNISAYALPKLPSIVGVRLTGQLTSNKDEKHVDMIVLPLRSDTLKIYTQGDQYQGDFNANILPNFSFVP